MSTQTLGKFGNNTIKEYTTVGGTLNNYQRYRHKRDPKLLAKQDLTNDNEIHIIKKIHNVTDGSLINRLAIRIDTDHTAETSTLTVEWGDGNTETFTPGSNSLLTVSHDYVYSDTDLSTYDSNTKQAYIKIYPTNDDFAFQAIRQNERDLDNNVNNHQFPINFTEFRIKATAMTYLFLHGYTGFSNVNTAAYGSNTQSESNFNGELEYIEIFSLNTSSNTRYDWGTISKQIPLKSVIIHDSKNWLPADWLEESTIEEFIIYDDTNTGTDIQWNERTFYRCRKLKYVYINTGKKNRFYERVFTDCDSLKSLTIDNVQLESDSHYTLAGSSRGLEELNVTFADGGDMRKFEGIGYDNNGLKWINNPNNSSHGNILDLSGLTGYAGFNEMINNFRNNHSLEQLHIILPNVAFSSSYVNFYTNFYNMYNLKSLTLENPSSTSFPFGNVSNFLLYSFSLEEFNMIGDFSWGTGVANNLASTFHSTGIKHSDLPTFFQTITLDGSQSISTGSFFKDRADRGKMPKLIIDNDSTGTGNFRIDNVNYYSQNTGLTKINTDILDWSDYAQSSTSAVGWNMTQMVDLTEVTGLDFTSFYWTGGQTLNFSYNNALEKFSGHTYPSASTMFNINLTYSGLTGTALNTLFTELPDLTGETSRTITISNSRGASNDSDLDTTIATNKNYTVTN